MKVKVNVLKESLELPDSMHNLRNLNIIDFGTRKVSLKNSTLPIGEDVGSHAFAVLGKDINSFLPYNRERQVCATESVAKNLSQQRTREKRAAGATKLSEADIKGKLVEFAWWMKKQGYAESSIESRGWIMKSLVNHGANLYDPESVKEAIANQEEWSDQYKVNVVNAYKCFVRTENLTWEPPNYKRHEKLPWIPHEKELDQLIMACGKIMGTFLQALKETGADPGELCHTRWIDIDRKRRTIAINHPVKGHNARIIKVSEDLIERLKLLPKKSERVFKAHRKSMNVNFIQQRKRIGKQFANPRLLEIKFTTFRHWKATTEYHRTKDILYVKQLLGHKNLSSTMIYIDVEKAIYGEEENNEFITRAATSVKGARALIEAGFEKADEIDGVHIYRKRK